VAELSAPMSYALVSFTTVSEVNKCLNTCLSSYGDVFTVNTPLHSAQVSTKQV